MSGLTIRSSPIVDWTTDQLGDVFLHGICPLLTHDVLADDVSLVCKQWKKWADGAPIWTAKQLSQLNVRIISRYAIEEELKRALPQAMFAKLSFDMIPQTIDFRMALIKAARFYARINAAGTAVEGDEGLFIIPRPKRLTLKMLHAAYPNRFGPIQYLMGNKKSEGGQFMVTSNILEKTRGISSGKQQLLCRQAGGHMPEVLNAVFFALMVEKFTEKAGFYTRCGDNPFDTEQPFSRGQSTYAIRPLSDDPLTYTRCLERIEWRLIVGGFAPDGLYVDDDGGCGHDVGAVAQRKF